MAAVADRDVRCLGVDVLAGLARWHEQGVWQRLHEVLLSELRAAGVLDLAYAVVDASHLWALKGGPRSARALSIAVGPVPSII